jgi:PAS domain S-box-containing protein
MTPSLFNYLTEHWGDTLTPLYLTFDNLQAIDRFAYTTTGEIAHDGIIAVQVPFEQPPTATHSEFRTIIEKASTLYLFARHSAVIPTNLPPTVTVVPLQPDGSWADEWFVVAYTPELTFVLCARSVLRSTSKKSTSHYALLRTVDPEIVKGALAYIQALAVEFSETVPHPPLPSYTLSLKQIEKFYQGITATLTNPKGTYPQLGLITADYYYSIEITPDGRTDGLRGYGRLVEKLGYTNETSARPRWREIVHPEDMNNLLAHFNRLVSGHEDVCEGRLLGADGAYIWVMNYAVPEWNESLGRVVRIHGAIRDITSMKYTEARLRASERRFAALFEHAPVMAVTTEYQEDSLYVTACNQVFLNTLGYRATEVIGQPLTNFYTDDSQKRLNNWIQHSFIAGNEFLIGERELITKDGRIITTLLHAVGLPAEAGSPPGTHALYVDITERKQFEAQLQQTNLELEKRVIERTASMEIANRVLNLKLNELEQAQAVIRESQERLEDFYDTTTDLVQVTDSTGKILYVNQAWRKMLGYELEDIEQLNAQNLFHLEDIQRIDHTVKTGLAEGKRVFELSSRIIAKDGRTLYTEGTVSFRLTAQGRHESQAVFRDVTARHYAEQQFREESDRYRLVVRSLPNTVLMLFDHELCYRLVEGNTLNLVGLSREYLEGKTLYEALPADEVAQLEPIYRRTLAGEAIEFPLNYRNRSYEIQFQPIYEGDVVTLGMIVALDVTERLTAEKERIESEARYRLVAENIPDAAIFLFDHDLRFMVASGPALAQRTFDEMPVEGQTLWDAMPQERADRLATIYKATLRGEKSEHDLTFGERTYNVRFIPVQIDNSIIGGLVVALDITERVRNEQLRIESEARYRLVAQNIPDSAVYVFDRDFRYLLAEGPALIAHKTISHPVEGRTIWDVLPPEHVEFLLPIYQATLEGAHTDFEMFAEDRFYSVHAKPVVVGEQIIGGLLLSHDITERKQTEASLRQAKETAEEATRAKSAFLANMSHEIRTPLNAIVGATGLMLNTELTDKQKEYANIVRVSSDSLLALVSDILDFSKIEAEKLELEERPFDLRSCVEETLELLQPQAATKHLDLMYTMEATAPEWVIGDKNRVRQILMNLLSNAVKFTYQGDVQVNIASHVDKQGSHYLDVAVQDTGIGINPEQDSLIFEAFMQADSSTTRRHGGTGLGLAICKRLTELMGGNIWFESTPNVGSTFHVTLQLPPASPYPLPFPMDEDATLVGKRILIVVANPTVRQLIAQQTRTWGMRPLVSALEQTALAFLRQPHPPFDMVLWDENISNHPDNPLFQIIQNRAEHYQIPVVLLGTGYPTLPEKMVSHTAHLQKPFKPGRFYEILTNLVNGVALTGGHERGNYLLDATLGQRFPLDILLAEDNLVNQRVTLAILERLGYQAKLVADGREALEATRHFSFDVILMDVQMPVLSGLEATQLIRRMGDRISQPFIIALTANAMQGDREQYLAAGMDAYLSKPLDISALQSTLQKAAEQKQSRAARSVMDKKSQKVHPVLDRAVLVQLSQIVGDTLFEPVATVIELFLEEAPHYVKALQQAVAAPDLNRSIEVAHTLKSSSAALGGMAFSARCASIEAHARAGRLMEASLAVSRLTDEYQILSAALLAWRRDALKNP